MDQTTAGGFSLKNELASILAFVRKPQYREEHRPFSDKLKSFFTIFILDIALAFGSGSLIMLAEHLGAEEALGEHDVEKMLNESPLWMAGLLIAVIIPFIEELIFRLPLKFRYRVINVAFTLLVLIITLNILFLPLVPAAKLVIGGVALAVIGLFAAYNARISSQLELFWDYKFPFVFYAVTALFAVVHVMNYSFSGTVLLLLPVLVLPQFIGGFFIGYLRVKYGFFWGVALHMLSNGAFVIPYIASLYMIFQPVEINNDNYKLTIDRSNAPGSADKEYTVGTDSISLRNIAFRDVLAEMLAKDPMFIDIEDPTIADIKLNVLYRNVAKTADTAKAEALNKERVLNEMKKAYNFTLVDEKEKMDHYELFIKDSARFAKHSRKAALVQSSQTVVRGDSYEMKNIPPDQLTTLLNEEYTGYFTSGISQPVVIDIKFAKLTFKELRAYLETAYGLSFKESKREVEFTKVEFE